jgi:hypothetical protein
MKHWQLKNIIGIFTVVVLALSLSACATHMGTVANTDVDAALRMAGFHARPATTDGQRSELNSLPEHQFTEVKQGGETYYLYPDRATGRVYAGNYYAYRAFVNNEENNRLRQQGALVFEKDPSNRSTNRTVVTWHDWSPFQQWE